MNTIGKKIELKVTNDEQKRNEDMFRVTNEDQKRNEDMFHVTDDEFKRNEDMFAVGGASSSAVD